MGSFPAISHQRFLAGLSSFQNQHKARSQIPAFVCADIDALAEDSLIAGEVLVTDERQEPRIFASGIIHGRACLRCVVAVRRVDEPHVRDFTRIRNTVVRDIAIGVELDVGIACRK